MAFNLHPFQLEPWAFERVGIAQHIEGRLHTDPQTYQNLRLRSIAGELYEHLLLQNLASAFDDIPMRRVFQIFLYTPEQTRQVDAELARTLEYVIWASGCTLVHTYPVLSGSKLYGGLLRSPVRQTHKEFDASQIELIREVVGAATKDNINVTININIGERSSPGEKGWQGKFKDVTEGLKNLLLIGAGTLLLFDGTLMSSRQPDPSKPSEVVISRMNRDTQLQVVPKVLDVTSPEEFREIMEPFHFPKRSPEKPIVPPRRPDSPSE